MPVAMWDEQQVGYWLQELGPTGSKALMSESQIGKNLRATAVPLHGFCCYFTLAWCEWVVIPYWL